MSTRLPLFALLAWLIFLTAFAGCTSARKSYNSGNYTSAIEKAVKKLRNIRTDEENIVYLEASYDKLYYQVKDRVSFLRKENRPENAVSIYDEYALLKMYEEMIKPLLPLYIESKKRQAQFKFISDDDFIEAKQLAAEYLYSYAGSLLKNSNRADARRAFELYDELKCIYPSYKDSETKQRDALAAGTNQVNLIIINKSGALLFSELEKQITTIPVGDLNDQWVNFSNNNQQNGAYDYQVAVTIRYLNVTPDLQLVKKTFTERKTIEDGWEYALDARGNVMKDSLGNDIKKTKYRNIACIVTEYAQQKQASIAGSIDFISMSNNSVLYSYPVDITEFFEHRWATASGDLRALSKESADMIKIGALPFPSETEMLLKAGDDLKMTIRNAVRDHIEILAGV
jgi:hypothetical protein